MLNHYARRGRDSLFMVYAFDGPRLVDLPLAGTPLRTLGAECTSYAEAMGRTVVWGTLLCKRSFGGGIFGGLGWALGFLVGRFGLVRGWVGSGLGWFGVGLVRGWVGSGLGWFGFGRVRVWVGSGLGWFGFGLVRVWAGSGLGGNGPFSVPLSVLFSVRFSDRFGVWRLASVSVLGRYSLKT